MLHKNIQLGNSSFSKKLFFNMLISFVTLIFLLVVSFYLLFSKIYNDTIFKYISSESISSLDRFSMEFDEIFSQIKQMNISISQNPTIYDFLYSSGDDYNIINNANNYLIQIKAMTSYLHSIILLNTNQNFQIVSGKPDVDVSQFSSTKLTRPKSKSNMFLIFSTTGLNSPEAKKTVQKTLSVVFSNYFDINKPLANSIISTLDRDEFENKLLDRFEGSTFIVDNDGQIIFNSHNSTKTDSSGNNSIIKEIISKRTNKGSFSVRETGESKIAFFIKSTETDFYIINVRSYHNITTDLRSKQYRLISISLIILIFFSIAVYIFTLKIYSPIKKVTEIFSNSKFKKMSKRMGEIDIISEVYNEAINQMQKLETINIRNKKRLKEDSLRLLLKNADISDPSKKEIHDYSLNIEFSNLLIVLVKIDNYTPLARGEILAYQAILCSIIPEILKEIFSCETVNMFDGEIALLLNFKDNANNNFNLLLAAMDKLRELPNNIHSTLTIGIGDFANSMEECVKAYNKALEMTKYRFTMGFNKTIYWKLVDENMADNIYYPSEIEDALVNSIRLNNKEFFVENLHNIVTLLKEYPYSDAVSIMFQIISSCIKVINQLIREDSQKFSLNFDEFSSIFSEMQTLEQTEIWLIRTFDEYQKTVEQIIQLKTNKHFKVVEKVEEYVNKNYQDINLSTESVAETVGYAPYYFSKVFKEITGFTVNNYIKKIRIDKAKEFLSQPDIKISDIPNMTGFTTINHFYFVFKKTVGLSPASYREYVLNQK